MVVSANHSEGLPARLHSETGIRSEEVEKLRAKLRQMERGFHGEVRSRNCVSSGVSALDDLLPDQGFVKGTLCEWISAELGGGAASLAMRVASQAAIDGPLIVVDRNRSFYAPAMDLAGGNLRNTIFVRPESRVDELWALEQCLRCPGVAAVLCQIDFLKTQEFRRLQLAVASGTALGILIRSAVAKTRTSWADVRLLVSPRPSVEFLRRLEVRCVYAKGHFSDRSVELTLCEETGELREAS
jgi:protein ImuA